jgi:hypothetical protein
VARRRGWRGKKHCSPRRSSVVRAARAALDALLPALTDAQRRTLDQLLAMAMPGGGPQTGMMSR